MRPPQRDDQAADRQLLKRLLAAHDFGCIAAISALGYVIPRRDATPEEHLADLRRQLPVAWEFEPRFINGYHGCDTWTWDQQRRFFAGFLALEREFGIPMTVETHRGRSLFNPWITRDLLAEFPLKLTCDFSHWVVVCERLIDSELPIIALCAQHCWHIHARVGYDQGPQVPDPRAPEFAPEVTAHERGWDRCWRVQAARGRDAMTLTPEFGNDGYRHHLLYTDMPVVDLWAICASPAGTGGTHPRPDRPPPVLIPLSPVVHHALLILAPTLALAGNVPYIIAMLRGRIRPNRATWLIYLIVGTCGCASSYAAGVRDALGVALTYVIGPVVISLLAITRGEGGWSLLDRSCLGLAALSLALWAITGDPVLAVVLTSIADLCGSTPTVLKAWRDPKSEDRLSWLMFATANLLNLLLIPYWSIGTALYPFALCVPAVTLAVLTTVRRRAV